MNRIRQFIAPPIFEDEEKTRTAGLLNIILIAVFVIASALTLVVGLLGSADMPSLATGAATAVWALVLWFVMRRGHVQLASVFLSFMFLVNVTVAVYFSGTIRDPVVTVYIVCIAVASLLVSNRAALVFTLLSLLALFGLLQAETAGLLTRTVQTPVGLTTVPLRLPGATTANCKRFAIRWRIAWPSAPVNYKRPPPISPSAARN
ncbi:MAG: hypothetical protein B6I34_08095 [Anaerolineaceae bacterium 4572_32.1]|nr:MAG: hypothetical protein B6I34_08095 [Anaerolineaceae bacterium 4572_32.1]